jgi:ribonuclease T2
MKRHFETGRRHARGAFVALLAALGVSLLVGVPADAQRATGGFARETNPYGRTQRVYEAGKFDYYLMALSWSPSYCAGLPRDGYDPQCNSRDGKKYAFVLHGVWPQFEKGWPQDCPTADRGFVPRPVAQRMLDIMPSEKLVFHEYRKHGTCSGLGVDGYFDLSRSLYSKVKIPAKYAQVNDPRMFVSTQEIITDFVAANPGLKPDGIVVECGAPGPRLKEVRICFDKGGAFRSCGRNENQRRLCGAPSVYVPPVRATPASAPPAGAPTAAGQKI